LIETIEMILMNMDGKSGFKIRSSMRIDAEGTSQSCDKLLSDFGMEPWATFRCRRRGVLRAPAGDALALDPDPGQLG